MNIIIVSNCVSSLEHLQTHKLLKNVYNIIV